MRHGRRDRVIRIFFEKILNRYNLWENFYKFQYNETNQNFFKYSNFFFDDYKNIIKFDSFRKTKNHLSLFLTLSNFEQNNLTKLKNFYFFNRNKKFEMKSSLFFKNSFLKLFSDINLIFTYFIYSVDKNIRKYSRGKSGKYSFVWKYIAPYKRMYVAMRLFAKELKFRNERQFHDRFLSSLLILEKDFKNSFVWQSKIFSHNYVFKNFKKTLIVSLKTMSK